MEMVSLNYPPNIIGWGPWDWEAFSQNQCCRHLKTHSQLIHILLWSNQVQGITSEFDVHIKFPDRSATDEATELNGGEPNAVNGEPIRQCDIIRITGLPDRCEAAKQALIDQIPVTEEINVPFDIHRWIIGQKGRDVRELMSRYDVHIELSPPEEKLDIIKITGTPANIEDAKKAIEQRVEQYEEGRKDRELRSFELKLEIDPIWHSKIIGRRGAVINKIRANHGVQVSRFFFLIFKFKLYIFIIKNHETNL